MRYKVIFTYLNDKQEEFVHEESAFKAAQVIIEKYSIFIDPGIYVHPSPTK